MDAKEMDTGIYAALSRHNIGFYVIIAPCFYTDNTRARADCMQEIGRKPAVNQTTSKFALIARQVITIARAPTRETNNLSNFVISLVHICNSIHFPFELDGQPWHRPICFNNNYWLNQNVTKSILLVQLCRFTVHLKH